MATTVLAIILRVSVGRFALDGRGDAQSATFGPHLVMTAVVTVRAIATTLYPSVSTLAGEGSVAWVPSV